VAGEVGLDGNVLVVRRIRVTYYLKVAPGKREVAERVLGFHADHCPMARTVRGCVEISTALETEDVEE
jgi:uncharacterized OsmC-like protein